jgi:hypothetical protein
MLGGHALEEYFILIKQFFSTGEAGAGVKKNFWDSPPERPC